MAYIVTSSFIDQSLKPVGATVARRFIVGGSDYSARVVKWPKFKRKAQEFKISNLKIQLANNDGALNNFYEQTYSMVTSAYVQFGFTNQDSYMKTEFSDDFETGDFSNWSGQQSSQISSTEVYSGNFSSFLISSETPAVGCYKQITINPYLKYRYSNFVNVTEITSGYCYNLLTNFYTKQDSFIIQGVSLISSITGDWINYSYTFGPLGSGANFIIPSNINYGNFFSCYFAIGGAGAVYSDQFKLEAESEVINLFTGNFSKVSYTREKTVIHLKDKLYDLTQSVIGDTSSPVDIQVVLPSDLAWTLCTCYGGLSNIQSISNPDIDFASFNRFAAVWSDSGILVTAHYEGEKVSEGLSRLSKITDSTIYGEGDGKIYFQRYSNVATETTVITENETVKVDLDVLAKSVINRQIIGWDYSQESSYSAKTVEAVNSTSQNSFGIYENFLEDNTVWFVNSTSALEMANRMLFRYRYPPKLWTVKTPLTSIIRQLGETAKLVNSFHNVTSADGQRITEITFDTHNSAIELKTDESVSFQGFILDVDSLDSTERFLL